MKRHAKKQTKSERSEREQMLNEDFRLMAEMHKVLSPFWSARAGYQNTRAYSSNG